MSDACELEAGDIVMVGLQDCMLGKRKKDGVEEHAEQPTSKASHRAKARWKPPCETVAVMVKSWCVRPERVSPSRTWWDQKGCREELAGRALTDV